MDSGSETRTSRSISKRVPRRSSRSLEGKPPWPGEGGADEYCETCVMGDSETCVMGELDMAIVGEELDGREGEKKCGEE